MGSIYSVGQVNTYIKNMFTQDFMLNRISVRGEVSNCKYHTSGHLYFSLKDASGSLACVLYCLSFYHNRRDCQQENSVFTLRPARSSVQ